MHCGSLENHTKPGQVYRYLRERAGCWCDSWELQQATHTTAVSTRISEIRCQLPAGERIETEQRGKQWFYRLVLAGRGQLEMFPQARAWDV